LELSIDTSTRYASVGVSRDGKTIAEHTWRSERNHSVELVPSIRTLMSQVGVEMNEMEAIFVAKGPGGFSALRVGMSTAKSLASALNIPLVSIGTLDVEAQPYVGLEYSINAVIEAGRNRVYVGRFGERRGEAEPKYEVASHDEFVSESETATLYCGEGIHVVAALLSERHGANALIADVPPPTRRAGVLAHLAYRRWQSGVSDDPATLQPLYLRSSQVNMARRTRLKA
jgi:tRNA threonylcarbamoyl adenosine modification protein YeaZ